MPGASPSWAAATARPPWLSSAWRTGSITSPPVAGPRSSSSSRATCPASPRCARRPTRRRPPVADGERKPLISGNSKMHLNHFEATALVQKLDYELTPEDYAAVDVSVHPPFTD